MMNHKMNVPQMEIMDIPLLKYPQVQVAALRVEHLCVEHWLTGTGSPISQHRKQHALLFLQEKDRQRSVGATLVLDHLLHKHQLQEKDMLYAENSAHKPYFKNYPQLHFNLSHSGAYAIAALAEVPVGIDIQATTGYQRDLARLCMSASEIEEIEACDPTKWDTLFTHLWCLKEAVLKAVGTGISEEEFPKFTLTAGMPQLEDDRYAALHTQLLAWQKYSIGIAF